MATSVAVAFLAVPAIAFAADPAGTKTFQADPHAAVNTVWVLIAAALVWIMQLGFAFLGAGLIRSKSTVNYFTMCYLDFCIGGLAFWAFGFALMFGGSKLWPGLENGTSILGYSGFFLNGASYDVSTFTGWFFEMVFAAAATTIVAGAIAERTKITGYLAYSFIISALIYPIYGHWVWGGGWLETLKIGSAVGVKDFAGSGVVHVVGGLTALVGAAMVGPRIGKFNADGTPNQIGGHNIPYVVIGAFILFFGWFGFNPGSTFAATDLRISVIAVNTFLAGAAGAAVAVYWTFARTGKADIVTTCNGSLAGLVGVTAACAFIPPWAAVVIGAVSPLVMIATANFVERKLKIDDAVGAVSVHAGPGLWGLLAVGIFADGTYQGVSGLIEGQVAQLALQIVDMGVAVAWTLATAFVCFWLIRRTIGLRASREDELRGLDVVEHGTEAYPMESPAGAGIGS